jgi:hypothetical protein
MDNAADKTSQQLGVLLRQKAHTWAEILSEIHQRIFLRSSNALNERLSGSNEID